LGYIFRVSCGGKTQAEFMIQDLALNSMNYGLSAIWEKGRNNREKGTDKDESGMAG
jgi:hypothetical protein